MDCIFLDVARITIGDRVFFGPRVGLYTPYHPIDATVRSSGPEGARPITIGNDVWFGGNVVVGPGVTIGDDVVIGAGSVVVKDIPSHSVAVGNPCHVIREITDADREYWEARPRNITLGRIRFSKSLVHAPHRTILTSSCNLPSLGASFFDRR